MNIEEMLDRLGSAIGPPPVGGVVPVPWELGPEAIGFQLPTDYRAFIDRYGMVSIRNELHIFAPSAAPSPKTGQPLGFEGFLYYTTDPYGYCAMLAQAYQGGDYDECPYPLFPAEGGLLKWGNNWCSDQFFWLMRDPDPDRWPVVAKFDSMREWDLFEGGFLEFLLAAVTEQYPYHGDVVPDGTKQVVDGRDYAPWGDCRSSSGSEPSNMVDGHTRGRLRHGDLRVPSPSGGDALRLQNSPGLHQTH
ncbi:hypothetical protein [Nocardia araoensis]|uniref:hypothetical protein n=1 Tax=Nocardia araoensis TaxID=228600 RepID=UPI0002FF25D9|nr:hypothetical protein [Nocardia araoensis]